MIGKNDRKVNMHVQRQANGKNREKNDKKRAKNNSCRDYSHHLTHQQSLELVKSTHNDQNLKLR